MVSFKDVSTFVSNQVTKSLILLGVMIKFKFSILGHEFIGIAKVG